MTIETARHAKILLERIENAEIRHNEIRKLYNDKKFDELTNLCLELNKALKSEYDLKLSNLK